jgi:predicted aminopeptidase
MAAATIKGRTRLKRWVLGGSLLLVVLAVSGCRTVSFYAQALKGQCQILGQEHAIPKLMADARTSEGLKKRFELLEELRGFAEKSLGLPVDGHYRKYADLHRPFVVWNVQAAPEFSMQPKTWWYPLVGGLEYRGYFTLSGATNYAAYLRRRGFDVAVGGVQAYSTLGWFKDPVLNTFLFEPDTELAELIFHELGHQRLFARGDTDFDEAFATTVGQEGVRRWLTARGDATALENYHARLRRNDDFVRLVAKTRRRLISIYGDEWTESGGVKATRKTREVPRDQLRQEKRLVLQEMKDELARLKQKWGSTAEYDDWCKLPINNADLNSVAAYYDLVPGFEDLLSQNGGDLEKFYLAAERLSRRPKKERQERLTNKAVTPHAGVLSESGES